MNLLIEPTRLEGHPLSRAYIDGRSEVAELYAAGPPDRLAAYAGVLEQVRANRPNAFWRSLPEIFEGAGPQERERIARVVEERGAFVVTGQQAGLFTGPLMTIYKALTAVRTAAILEDRLDAPIVPLFWIASEDHDWAEVNHAHVIDLENRLRRIQVEREEAPDGPGDPIHRIQVPPSIENATAGLNDATPDSEFKEDVLGPLRSAYRPGHGFAKAFQDAIRDLLGRFGLLTVQASHAEVKVRSAALLNREWSERKRSAELLAERARRIEGMGFPLQVGVSEAATQLFVEGPRGRDRLLIQGEGAVLRAAGVTLEPGALERMLRDEPQRVSPGALLGPVVQAGAFPVIAHVVGPSEIAYLAQNQPLFELHEVPAPVVVPRASLRLIEARVEKVLEKYGLSAENVEGDGSEWIDERIRSETPDELTDALAALKRSAGAALEEVERVAVEFDPGSRSAVGSGRNSLFQAISELEKKLGSRVKERHDVMRRQLEKAAVHLSPRGRPQERMLNVYPYLIRYGRELLDAIHDRIEPAPQ